MARWPEWTMLNALPGDDSQELFVFQTAIGLPLAIVFYLPLVRLVWRNHWFDPRDRGEAYIFAVVLALGLLFLWPLVALWRITGPLWRPTWRRHKELMEQRP